jgi:hypothetical protein
VPEQRASVASAVVNMAQQIGAAGDRSDASTSKGRFSPLMLI